MKKFIFSVCLLGSLSLLTPTTHAMEYHTSTFSFDSGKKIVRYVEFKKSEDLELRPYMAWGKTGYTEDLAGIVKDAHALAGINGTYFNSYSDKQPEGSIMVDRDMQHLGGGPIAMGITADNDLLFGDTNSIRIQGTINGSSDWQSQWYAWAINHTPNSKGEIIIYTPKFKQAQLSFPHFTYVTVENGRVKSVHQGSARIPANGFVIAFDDVPNNSQYPPRFHEGDLVAYQVTLPGDLQSTESLISVGPSLLTNGQITIDLNHNYDDSITKESERRSFVGETKDQQIVIGSTDRAKLSELATMVQKMGLYNAMSLDSGGSSGLVYHGKYMATPSRAVSNALVIVKKSQSVPPAPVQKPILIEIDGKPITTSTPPYIQEGVTMVPVHGILEELGMTLTWDGEKQRVVASKGNLEIDMTIGQSTALVNGLSQTLTRPPVLRNERTYVPLRWLAESMNAHVEWDQQTNTVRITTH